MPRRWRAEFGGRSRRAVLVLIGSLAVLAAAGSIAGTRAESPPLLVFASDRAPDYYSEIYSLDLAGGVRRDVSNNERPDRFLALRGRQIVFESERSGAPALYIAQLDSHAPPHMLFGLPADTEVDNLGASWSPGGRELAVAMLRASGRGRYVIELVDPRSGRKLAQIENSRPAAPALGLATTEPGPSMWSADGRRLAYDVVPAGREPVIRFVDARGLLHFSRHGDQALWALAAPRVAIIAGPYGAGTTVVDDEQGRAIAHFQGRALALSPDGRTLVLARSGTLWLASVDTGNVQRLANSEAEVVAFSPNGAHVEVHFATGQTATIFNVSSRRIEAHLPGFGEWFADSRRLAVVTSPAATSLTIVTAGGRVLRRASLLPGSEFLEALFVTRDGKTLVYGARSLSAHQLYEQLGSGDLRQLTSGSADHQDPAPSPDGKLIADAEFETPCGMCSPPQIAVLASDGSAPAQLLPNQVMGNGHPSWSPDGTRIAYGENAAPDILGIFVMHADGSQPVKLDGGAGGTEPTWAPDGSAIAGTRAGIFVMAGDGINAQQLTGPVPAGSPAELTRAPAWSPDSASLAFAGADGLYGIARDGSSLHLITAMPGIVAVSWSPNGMLIAFAAGCQGTKENCANDRTHDIWTVRPDGNDLRRITDDVADDTAPTWLPAP